jgi:hypothetical protein
VELRLGGYVKEPTPGCGLANYSNRISMRRITTYFEGQRSRIHPNLKHANEFGRPCSQGRRRASRADAAWPTIEPCHALRPADASCAAVGSPRNPPERLISSSGS